MSKYHVACGMFGIYAGTVKSNGKEWKEKSEVTDEAIDAVRDYMFDRFITQEEDNGGYKWKRTDGRTVRLLVVVTKEDAHE